MQIETVNRSLDSGPTQIGLLRDHSVGCTRLHYKMIVSTPHTPSRLDNRMSRKVVWLKKKKKTCHLVDFVVPTERKWRKVKNWTNTRILPENLKRCGTCNVTMISIVAEVLGTVPKYLEKDWFGLVWFYGISTIVGYLMPNPLHTYILNI